MSLILNAIMYLKGISEATYPVDKIICTSLCLMKDKLVVTVLWVLPLVTSYFSLLLYLFFLSSVDKIVVFNSLRCAYPLIELWLYISIWL